MVIGRQFNPYKTFVGSFIPNCLMRYQKLSSTAKLCWARLAQYAGENGIAFPSIETLAEEIGISRRQCINILNELESKGFIQRIKPEGQEKLMHQTNKYIFLWHECFNGQDIKIPNGNNGTSDGEVDCIPHGEIYCTSHDEKNFTQRESYRRESNRRESNNKYADCKQSDFSKEKFLDHVFLTKEEHDKLINSLGIEDTNFYIQRLNDYIAQIGQKKADAKYKSHYHVILNWYRRNEEAIKARIKIMEALRKKEEEKYIGV